MLFIPFLQLIYTDDNKLAVDLCKKDKQAISEFLELYSDELYFISSKFNNRGFEQGSWDYRTKTGYTIQVTDDVSDTFLWLIKQVQNKSCAYRGDRGATFSTFIKSALNSSFTFKDWLKWKTGVTGYVPKCIKNLNEPYIKIYKLLRQNKSDEEICNSLNLEYVDFYEYYQDIESKLIDSNQIQLIKNPKLISIDSPLDNDGEGEKVTPQISSDEFEKPDDQPDIIIIKELASSVLEHLTDAQRRLLLLYWGKRQTVQEIYDTFSLDIFEDYKIELNINESNDIYTAISKTVKSVYQLTIEQHSKIVSEYSITESSLKRFLKIYYHYFENQQ